MDNIYLGASVVALFKSHVDGRYDEIVAFAALERFTDRPVKTYSSGMSMRLAFAVATAADPDIRILDETLSVGDGAFARKSFDRIIHSMYQIEAVCNRVIWLNQGRVVMDGDPARIASAYADFLKGLEKRRQPEGAGRVSPLRWEVRAIPVRTDIVRQF